MKPWLAELDAVYARVNPGLVVVDMLATPLDLALAAQRWTAARPGVPVPVGTVAAEGRSSIIPAGTTRHGRA